MKYDFDTPVNRRGTNSLKWDIAEKELPMWVADMDFRTAPEVTQAILERAGHGVFGYSIIPDAWGAAYSEWWDRRHGFKLDPDRLIFTTGVIPAISSVVRKITTPAEKVLIQTPVYNIFFNSILNNGREVLEAPLKYNGGEYAIDFAELEEKLSDPQVSLMILCNPHNPIGKIWDKDTLSRIGELCFKYNVTVLSDEIHCDITDPGKEYIPFASVSDVCRDNSITCITPTKAFNIAGMQTAAVYVPNKSLHHKVWRGLNTDEVAEPNAFAIQAAIAAFTKGADWLDALRAYIYENKMLARDFIAKEIPSIKLVSSEATYLLWLDCSGVTDDVTAFTKFIRSKTGLYLSKGEQYGSSGKDFIRMNIACPRSFVSDGLSRLKEAIENY